MTSQGLETAPGRHAPMAPAPGCGAADEPLAGEDPAEAPGPRLNPVTPSPGGSSTRGGWGQRLMLSGAPAVSQPGHNGL